MTADILPFLKGGSFDPEMTHAMGAAYDKARKMLHDKGQPFIVQEIIARNIIEVARTGERDPDKICARVMISFGFKIET
jgi:hypothetical protein